MLVAKSTIPDIALRKAKDREIEGRVERYLARKEIRQHSVLPEAPEVALIRYVNVVLFRARLEGPLISLHQDTNVGRDVDYDRNWKSSPEWIGHRIPSLPSRLQLGTD